MMRNIGLLLLFLWTISACSSEPHASNGAASDVPAFNELVESFFETYAELPQVTRIVASSETEEARSEFDHFSTDTLKSQVQSFTWSTKERTTSFKQTDTIVSGYTCKIYIPQRDFQINYLSVCRKGDKIVSVEARKVNNSMLNKMTQRIYFRPASDCKIEASFIDKIRDDSFEIQTTYQWPNQ